ncbi:MAG TPA: L,D-transpeptidase [Spirochaetota bacterium]|nr:L,D-transpeptidase [Spirochaetota bacterium]HNT11760.1 L,D-transpeptidase [Spirochaetota bacterium]HNV48735.1 L,D-transpeptidase [Spirochaetota bacterium]HOS40018.1 L,D-transpeptidase [Spirochaetota bacterium]HPU88715.1 L,D-transpeptidase [Spirochaetota bacterium]
MNKQSHENVLKPRLNVARSLVLALGLMVAFSTSCVADVKSELRKAFAKHPGPYAIHVSKGEFTLRVINRKLETVASYRVGYGRNGDRRPKLYEGDLRTPEGTYEVTEILSMDAGKNTESYRKLKMMNETHFYAKDGHFKFGRPKEDLGTDVYGPRFFRISYPNAADERRYAAALKKGSIPRSAEDPDEPAGIGFGIAIHGNNDAPGVGQLSSSGCVRMRNNDVVELDRFVRLGTPVVITAN